MPKGGYCQFWSQGSLDYACYLESQYEVHTYQAPAEIFLSPSQKKQMGNVPDLLVRYRNNEQYLIDIFSEQFAPALSESRHAAWTDYCTQQGNILFRPISAESLVPHETYSRNWYTLTRWLVQFPEHVFPEKQIDSVGKFIKRSGPLPISRIISFFDAFPNETTVAIIARLFSQGVIKAPLSSERLTFDTIVEFAR